MAYTISEPIMDWLPGENISWFTANSTDKNESSFVYRYRLQVTEPDLSFSSSATGPDVVGTFRVPPRPVTGVGYFSPNAIAKNYVTTPLTIPTGNAVGVTQDGVRKMRITYGQEYVTNAGATGMDEVTGNTYWIWNSVVLDEDFPSWNEDTYVIGNYSTPTDTQLLTDGPNTRCVLENDLLYAVVRYADYSYIRNRETMIGNPYYFFQTPANLNNWSQIEPDADSDPSFSWTALGGQGVIADNQMQTGEYSLILTYQQSPARTLGPVWDGDEISIQLETTVDWTDKDVVNNIWLMGKNRAGAIIPIRAFDEFENFSTNKLQYQIGIDAGDYAITGDWQWLGFAVKSRGFQDFPTISIVTTWTYYSNWRLYWEKNAASYTMPYRYPITSYTGRLTYINVGTDGIADTNEDYEVYIVNGIGTRLSEIITYTNDCDTCSNCDKVSLIWLNSVGGYDTFEFNCVQNKNLEATRVIGERTLTPGYVVGQRGALNTSNVAKRRKVVNTNWTTQTNADWLESLFMSPDVYELHPDGTLIPVVIDTTSYSQFVKQDKLKLIEFSYSLAYNRKSQVL